jgi:hypothetical protein
MRLGTAHLVGHITGMADADTTPSDETTNPVKPSAPAAGAAADTPSEKAPREIGGPKGPEPTRYGDWEQNGRCTDF